MFIRKSFKKGRTYYELVETIWRREKPRTRFIAYLGKTIPSDEALLRIYEEKTSKLNKAYLRGQKEGMDSRLPYNRMLDRYETIRTKRPLSHEEKAEINQANLRSRKLSQAKLLEALGFIKFRKGYLDPSRQVFLSLETGEVVRRKNRRMASVLVGKTVYDTESFKQQLSLLALKSKKLEKLVGSENKGISLPLEEFRKMTGT